MRWRRHCQESLVHRQIAGPAHRHPGRSLPLCRTYGRDEPKDHQRVSGIKHHEVHPLVCVVRVSAPIEDCEVADTPRLRKGRPRQWPEFQGDAVALDVEIRVLEILPIISDDDCHRTRRLKDWIVREPPGCQAEHRAAARRIRGRPRLKAKRPSAMCPWVNPRQEPLGPDTRELNEARAVDREFHALSGSIFAEEAGARNLHDTCPRVVGRDLHQQKPRMGHWSKCGNQCPATVPIRLHLGELANPQPRSVHRHHDGVHTKVACVPSPFGYWNGRRRGRLNTGERFRCCVTLSALIVERDCRCAGPDDRSGRCGTGAHRSLAVVPRSARTAGRSSTLPSVRPRFHGRLRRA